MTRSRSDQDPDWALREECINRGVAAYWGDPHRYARSPEGLVAAVHDTIAPMIRAHAELRSRSRARGTVKPPPDPTCTCGHPRATHHPTSTGRITYCTVWTSAIGQCPCKTYTQDHQHEGWQLRDDPEGRTYCAACGAQVPPTPGV